MEICVLGFAGVGLAPTKARKSNDLEVWQKALMAVKKEAKI